MDSIKGFFYTFTTDRQVAFYDKKLGIFWKVVQLCVLGVILYDLFKKQLYFKTEIPSGYTTMWAEVNDLYNIQRNATKTIPTYCDNEDYNYIYSLPYWDYRNNSCINLHYSEMYEKGENEIFFQSFFTENKIILQDCDHFEYYNDTKNCKIIDRLDGQCFCQNYKNFYSIGVEGMYLAFNHLYTTSFESGSNIDSNTEIRPIKTIIKNYKKEDALIFNKGDNIMISIKDWLTLSGIDLDDYNKGVKMSEKGDNIKNATYPRYRMSGLEIILKVNYYNIKDYSDFDEPVCIIDVVTNKGWASKGSKINYINYPNLINGAKNETNIYIDRYRYGIKFKFIVSGLMGQFDWYMLISHLVSVIVLTGTARTAVSFFIMYFLGNKSELFKKYRVKTIESDLYKNKKLNTQKSSILLNPPNNIRNRKEHTRKRSDTSTDSSDSNLNSSIESYRGFGSKSDLVSELDLNLDLEKSHIKNYHKDFNTLSSQFSLL